MLQAYQSSSAERNPRTPGFVIVPAELLQLKGKFNVGDGRALIDAASIFGVYCTLRSYATKNNTAWVSHNTLAHDCGLERRKIMRILKALTMLGAIVPTEREGTSSTYEVVERPVAYSHTPKIVAFPPVAHSHTPVAEDHNPVAEDHTPVAYSPRPVAHSHTRKKEQEKEEVKMAAPSDVDDASAVERDPRLTYDPDFDYSELRVSEWPDDHPGKASILRPNREALTKAAIAEAWQAYRKPVIARPAGEAPDVSWFMKQTPLAMAAKHKGITPRYAEEVVWPKMLAYHKTSRNWLVTAMQWIQREQPMPSSYLPEGISKPFVV